MSSWIVTMPTTPWAASFLADLGRWTSGTAANVARKGKVVTFDWVGSSEHIGDQIADLREFVGYHSAPHKLGTVELVGFGTFRAVPCY